jgi:hypothetical protein
MLGTRAMNKSEAERCDKNEGLPGGCTAGPSRYERRIRIILASQSMHSSPWFTLVHDSSKGYRERVRPRATRLTPQQVVMKQIEDKDGHCEHRHRVAEELAPDLLVLGLHQPDAHATGVWGVIAQRQVVGPSRDHASPH